ncbi:MAG: hypothetical protein FJX52_14040, partial [Alphaproteobacteria bacterium]|nr:hypothetical protein [Alphaproteobacteria bacterium]
MKINYKELLTQGRRTIGGVPEGYDAMVLAEIVAAGADLAWPVVHIARDDARLALLANGLQFFAP